MVFSGGVTSTEQGHWKQLCIDAVKCIYFLIIISRITQLSSLSYNVASLLSSSFSFPPLPPFFVTINCVSHYPSTESTKYLCVSPFNCLLTISVCVSIIIAQSAITTILWAEWLKFISGSCSSSAQVAARSVLRASLALACRGWCIVCRVLQWWKRKEAIFSLPLHVFFFFFETEP